MGVEPALHLHGAQRQQQQGREDGDAHEGSARRARSTSDRVRSLLLSKTPGSVTETDVASAMFVSKRTLARRLAAEGSSYHNVREQLLSELARRHLRESRLSVEAVATLLGYNDAAAFRKAFRRWYGQSPKAFRDNNHA